MLITGQTGVGKTHLACALGQFACRGGYRTIYKRLPRLLEELTVARADGSYARLLSKIEKSQLLIIDDWGLTPLKDSHRRDLLEILEDRHGHSSTVITSQLPLSKWRLPDTVKEWAQLETFLSHIETAQFPKADSILQFCSRYRLSLREREVLRSCVTGANNDEIASLLKCSRSTISTYWNRIFKKLGVGSVTEVLLRMMEVQDVRSCPTGYTFEVEASSVTQRE